MCVQHCNDVVFAMKCYSNVNDIWRYYMQVIDEAWLYNIQLLVFRCRLAYY